MDRDALIQGGQFALLVNSQTGQIDICYLSMCEDRTGFQDFEDADIFCPKLVALRLAKLAKHSKHSEDISGPIGVVRMAGDADKAVFREGTGGPGLVALICEPAMGRFMMDVQWISQRKQ